MHLRTSFQSIEDKWPGIVDRIHRRENVNDSLEEIFQFMALQRARVPASRDATERIHAEDVMAAGSAVGCVKGNYRRSLWALKTFLTMLKYLSIPTNPFTPWFP